MTEAVVESEDLGVTSAAELGSSPFANPVLATDASLVTQLCIDAGVGHLRLIGLGTTGEWIVDRTLPSDERLRGELPSWRSLLRFGADDSGICITGKLAPLVREILAGA